MPASFPSLILRLDESKSTSGLSLFAEQSMFMLPGVVPSQRGLHRTSKDKRQTPVTSFGNIGLRRREDVAPEFFFQRGCHCHDTMSCLSKPQCLCCLKDHRPMDAGFRVLSFPENRFSIAETTIDMEKRG
ncbi:hypothetical protein LIA77_03919 [Sarocladium implicatum]|nr:hypothetical protein LIA77_03919 [Sarocladium implicatum]